MNGNGPWRIRLRDVVLVVLVPFMALAMLIGPVWVAQQFSRSSLDINCQLIDANIRELQTLKLISVELGIPAEFDIPERPLECVEPSG